MSLANDLILGTASWGWGTAQRDCFALLDHFYAEGGRQVDTATNYPINKQPEDFRKAEQVLQEWIKANNVTDLRVLVKVGSMDNMRTPDHNLSKSFLLLMLSAYQQLFGANLHTFAIHWDNRDDTEAIHETFQALATARAEGLELGLSGIRHPERYAEVNENYGFSFHIQFKHNLLYSDYERYEVLHPCSQFIAYGVNAGGLKLDAATYHEQSSLIMRGGAPQREPAIVPALRQVSTLANQNKKRPAITSMNQCGMVFALLHPGIGRVLLGPSRLSQLQDTLRVYQEIRAHGYHDFYQALRQVYVEQR